jgi:hypothetical protein
MTLSIGDKVFIRIPSIAEVGYVDIPCSVAEVLPGEVIHARRDNDPFFFACGQQPLGPDCQYGWRPR